MKVFALLFLLLLFPPVMATAEPVDYGRADNWVIREVERPEAWFDVFYVYPTLFSDRNYPYMRWRNNPELREKTSGFVTAQTGIFGGGARIFAPYVRQLDYSRCDTVLEKGHEWRGASGLARGVEDTVDAFRYYLTHFNRGRPYVLFGHSQGAVDLYEMMRKVPEVTPERGFVAAYLIGLPRLSGEVIAADFKSRGILPADNERGVGVIVGWNTQSPDAEGGVFTVPGTYCINPLNWRTDSVPAPPSLNRGAFFYDYRVKNPAERVRTKAEFCGAAVAPERGALIVDLPSDSEYDARGFMGRGVFHMNDVWFFAGNLRHNAALRAEAWMKKFRDR